MDDVAVIVAEHLDLDVPGSSMYFSIKISRRQNDLPRSPPNGSRPEPGVARGDPHTLAAATGKP
jgi:hypothetical protein